jgi:hypothetical protein
VRSTTPEGVSCIPHFNLILKSIVFPSFFLLFLDEKQLVSQDGRCGPDFKNATCYGTEAQCCNSKTWKCGESK